MQEVVGDNRVGKGSEKGLLELADVLAAEEVGRTDYYYQFVRATREKTNTSARSEGKGLGRSRGTGTVKRWGWECPNRSLKRLQRVALRRLEALRSYTVNVLAQGGQSSGGYFAAGVDGSVVTIETWSSVARNSWPLP